MPVRNPELYCYSSVWALPLSLATTYGISVDFFSCGYLDVSVPHVSPCCTMLILTVFAREIRFLEDDKKIKNPNQIFLNGFICKKPVYRTTPFGREITDILLAVNRPYNKSDYIPCICWGRNARYSAGLEVGQNIKIWEGYRAESIRKSWIREKL